jgi:hypothetical protein
MRGRTTIRDRDVSATGGISLELDGADRAPGCTGCQLNAGLRPDCYKEIHT